MDDSEREDLHRPTRTLRRDLQAQRRTAPTRRYRTVESRRTSAPSQRHPAGAAKRSHNATVLVPI
ncbi:hypothetical protein ACFPRL_04655 [Pseudoclavibacter helvolus]